MTIDTLTSPHIMEKLTVGHVNKGRKLKFWKLPWNQPIIKLRESGALDPRSRYRKALMIRRTPQTNVDACNNLEVWIRWLIDSFENPWCAVKAREGFYF